jgi:hypothetical protein
MEGDRVVTVLVATELLAGLREWSQPVQVQIIETPGHGTGWELTFRINEVDVRAERDAAVAKLEKIGAALARIDSDDACVPACVTIGRILHGGTP